MYSLVNISEEISNAFGDNFKILWDGKNVSTPSNTLKNNKYWPSFGSHFESFGSITKNKNTSVKFESK